MLYAKLIGRIALFTCENIAHIEFYLQSLLLKILAIYTIKRKTVHAQYIWVRGTDISTLTSRDLMSWATVYKGTTTVIRRPEKAYQRILFGKRHMKRNLGRYHGPNSMQLAAYPTRLFQLFKQNKF